LLGLFNLLRIELNLRRIDGVRATMAFGVTLFRWLHVTIVVIVLGWLGCGLTSSLAVLLRNPTFELVNCTFLELLSHLLLLTEPGVFCLASFINISCMILCIRCLRMALWSLGCISLLSVWRCHVEHHIIQLLISLTRCIHVWRRGLARTSCTTTTSLWLLSLYVDILILQ
jgi:hypothetical protein